MPVSADSLRTHIDYSCWASTLLLDAAAQLSPAELTQDFKTADRSVLDTLVHVYAADRLWLSRLSGSPHPGFVTEADRSLEALRQGWPVLIERWTAWSAGLTDESALSELAYSDMKGNRWKQPFWQLILHVVNHGTHHRGQVSGFLRSMGHPPPQLDLTRYYRETTNAAVEG